MYNFLDDEIGENRGRLYAAILAHSGDGKSYTVGTYPGKVLHITGKHEAHGAIQSKKAAENHPQSEVVAVRWDYTKNEGQLDADQALNHLRSRLLDAESLKAAGIQAVAIDGMTELELLIKETVEWRSLCSTRNGEIDGFRTGAATVSVFRSILSILNDLYEFHGIDVIMTGIISVASKSDIGEVLEAKPKLSEYEVAETVVMTFGTILPVGPMLINGQKTHKFQFNAVVKSVSKDQAKQIKKFTNFTPRVAGFDSTETPRTLDANLAVLLDRMEKGQLKKIKEPTSEPMEA